METDEPQPAQPSREEEEPSATELPPEEESSTGDVAMDVEGPEPNPETNPKVPKADDSGGMDMDVDQQEEERAEAEKPVNPEGNLSASEGDSRVLGESEDQVDSLSPQPDELKDNQDGGSQGGGISSEGNVGDSSREEEEEGENFEEDVKPKTEDFENEDKTEEPEAEPEAKPDSPPIEKSSEDIAPEVKQDEEPDEVRSAVSASTSQIQMNNEDIKPSIPLAEGSPTPKSEAEGEKDEEKADEENALSALAAAAMDHAKEADSKPISEPKDPKEVWHTVGFIKGTSCNVQDYFYLDDSKLDFAEDSLPDVSGLPRIALEPGTAYKFRVAAINSVGPSDWSEVSAFKTCVPGFPSAPSAIKIAKSADGAHISWEPPKGLITEYSVYLAVRNAKDGAPGGAGGGGGAAAASSMAFVRVYAGPSSSCVVPHSSLATAHVDTTTKSAIIFRIAARNEKGYGPATQVRWLQESAAGKAAGKRAPDDAQAGLKKTRAE